MFKALNRINEPHYRSLRRLGTYVLLIGFSAILLYFRKKLGIDFFDELAAIPLEILLGVLVARGYIARANREKKKHQLMYIKGYLFRSQMRNLFVANFNALKEPQIQMSEIRQMSLAELFALRDNLGELKYKSERAREQVLVEYINATEVFQGFMDWAIANEFDPIFDDMIFLLHFIQDVKLFKEHNPKKLFITAMKNNAEIMAKVDKVLSDGVLSFLNYCIELKEKNQKMFDEITADYEISMKMA